MKLFFRKSLRFSLFQLWHFTHLRQKEKEPTVFILGHMRSGSSLLMHLLITHPKLIGYGERNAIYQTEKDFNKLIFHTRFERQKFFQSYDYFVDQINHNHHTPNVNLLKRPTAKYIFLVRQPKESISSILKLSRKYYDGWSPEKATDYYISRLTFLEALAKELSLSNELCLVCYQDLILRTDTTLLKLQGYLNLKEALSEQYDVYKFTGLRGDPSSKMKAGRIIRKEKENLISLPTSLLKKANVAFEQCHEKLSTYCSF